MPRLEDFSHERVERTRKLAEWLNENEFDAALILKEDLELFSGNYLYYGGSVAPGEYGAIIIHSSSERSAIAHEYSFQRVKGSGEHSKVLEIRQSADELVNALKTILRSKKVALDFGATTSITNLIKASGIRIEDNALREFIFEQRSIKSAYEIREMEKAIKVARRAFEKTILGLAPGLRIREISRMLNSAFVDEGGSGPSFEADIRIRRDLRDREADKLRKGDLLLFDFGVRIESNYLSDVGRTIPFGRTSGKEVDFLNDACSIKREGVKKISSGKSGNQVREEIDNVIREHGYVSTHRPGHQIGLNVHEPYGPHLNYGKENSLTLEVGNVVTWEPGISYPDKKLPPNRFGMAHMEDMVLVQRESSRMLGGFPLEYW